MNILLVDDDAELASLLGEFLRREAFTVEAAHEGNKGLERALQPGIDLVVLDVMLPGIDGFEILRRLRQKSAVPVIMLTARSEDVDRIVGLELGADDYLTKPFSPRELLLRVKKILARFQTEEKPKEQLRYGDLLVDLPRHIASWKGKPIELTATEFKLLVMLAQRSGRVQSRDQLLRDVGEYDSLIDTRTVDTHMRRLREKLGPASKHLDTVRGVGYRFVE